MSEFASEASVWVHPFTRQLDGEEVVIGRSDTGVFLVLPAEGLTILDNLALGKTVGEVQKIFREEYGETPDMQEFLEYLESKGIVGLAGTEEAESSRPQAVRFHFANISEERARLIFSRPVLLICGALIALAILCLVDDLSILPGWKALFFEQNLTLNGLMMLAFYSAVIFIHEMAHLVAARSVGVNSRLGIGHRLWTLVAETDMSGLWGLPRRKRYLPILAGPLVDATAAAILIMLLFSTRQGWIYPGAGFVRVGSAMLLVYLLSLLWQCFLFVRTDFYYVIATWWRCKNLLNDTEIFLWNKVGRFFRNGRPVEQSHIPETEMNVIRAYSWVWVMGRMAALCALVFVHIPLVSSYVVLVWGILAKGFSANRIEYVDAMTMSLISIAPLCIGMWLWLRSLAQGYSQKLSRAAR